MRRDIFKDAVECADASRVVVGNAHMMFPSGLRREINMAAGLTNNPVTQPGQKVGQVPTIKIAGEFHAAKTSSRTKCSLTMRGR